jgi:hypothetical protein
VRGRRNGPSGRPIGWTCPTRPSPALSPWSGRRAVRGPCVVTIGCPGRLFSQVPMSPLACDHRRACEERQPTWGPVHHRIGLLRWSDFTLLHQRHAICHYLVDSSGSLMVITPQTNHLSTAAPWSTAAQKTSRTTTDSLHSTRHPAGSPAERASAYIALKQMAYSCPPGPPLASLNGEPTGHPWHPPTTLLGHN